MTHPFNSDPVYSQLFRSHWLAEWDFYNSSQFYAGQDGRYIPTTPVWEYVSFKLNIHVNCTLTNI